MPMSSSSSSNLAGRCLPLLFFLLSVKLAQSDVLDQWTNKGLSLIADSKIEGNEIRQCTCEEQSACIDEMQSQAMGCVDTCWPKFIKIIKEPQVLRKCFLRTDVLIEQFISCFEETVQSCLPQREQKMIPKVNLTEMFRLGVERIEKTKEIMRKSLADGPIRKILNTASEFGICVKDCFLAKNPDQFCFDKKDCQPLLLGAKTTKSLRRCTKRIDWKKESGELCDCSVKAGLHEMDQYCPMLKLMGGRAGAGSGQQRRPTAAGKN